MSQWKQFEVRCADSNGEVWTQWVWADSRSHALEKYLRRKHIVRRLLDGGVTFSFGVSPTGKADW